MDWNRRRDLEGGKEIGIWIGTDNRELYVEDLTYRGDGYSVYIYNPGTDAWDQRLSTEDREQAFETAVEITQD
jgi:hypothetical protein